MFFHPNEDHINTEFECENQSNAEFNESEKLFSQVDVFEESTISTKEQHFESVESAPSDAQPTMCQGNPATVDVLQSNLAEAESYNDGSVPTATSSCISTIEINNAATPKMNDTTQELNLEAFNSDLEEMDKLEFTSSDSPVSSDSGNITANTSSAITTENLSANRTTDTCQTTNSLTEKQSLADTTSSSEEAITSTAFETDVTLEMDVGAETNDAQCSADENELIQDQPQPTSTSQDTFDRVSKHSDTNCTFELNSSSEVSHANSSMFKVQTDISNADCEQAQENVVSTSNEDGVVAEPSNDYVESAQRIHSMATCSTPARAISKFDTCHSIVGSTQQNVANMLNVHCLSTQLNMNGAALSMLSSAEIKPLEQEKSKGGIEKANPVDDTTIESDSLTKLDISDTKNVSTVLEIEQTFENSGSSQNYTDATAIDQQSREIISTTDDHQGKIYIQAK